MCVYVESNSLTNCNQMQLLLFLMGFVIEDVRLCQVNRRANRLWTMLAQGIVCESDSHELQFVALEWCMEQSEPLLCDLGKDVFLCQ